MTSLGGAGNAASASASMVTGCGLRLLCNRSPITTGGIRLGISVREVLCERGKFKTTFEGGQ